MMAEVEGQAKASRKQQNKVKKDKRDSEKTVKRSRAREADVVVDAMFDLIEADKRDLSEMSALFDTISELKQDMGKGEALAGDWKLVFVNTADALDEFGTGLGKLPGTSIVDLFVSLDKSGAATVTEVCRVLGPFPNLRNELRGSWKYAENSAVAGFKGSVPVAQEGLTVSYVSMVDGRDRMTDSSTGFKLKSVTLDVRFADDVVLVATLPGGLELVFEQEPDLQVELGKLLRKDLTKEDKSQGPSGPAAAVMDPMGTLAALATGAKKPWDLFK